MTSALRQRLHRARAAAGRIMVQIEVDEVAVAELLIGAELLDEFHRDDRLRIAAGIERLLALMLEIENGG